MKKIDGGSVERSRVDCRPKIVELNGQTLVLMDLECYNRMLRNAEAILQNPAFGTVTLTSIPGTTNCVAEVRKRKGVSVETLAHRLRLTPKAARRLESKRADLTLSNLTRIARTLHCSVRELIE